MVPNSKAWNLDKVAYQICFSKSELSKRVLWYAPFMRDSEKQKHCQTWREHCYAAKLVVLAVIGLLVQIFLMVLYGRIGTFLFHFQTAFPIGAACEWVVLE